MKKLFWILTVVLLSCSHAFSQDSNSDDVYYSGDDYNSDSYNSSDGYNSNVDYQTFHDELNPYGQWINYPGYGNAWVPNVSVGFSPYLTGGQWVYTQYGWTWASDYAWGWAPFHYGRWMYDPFYGWVWVPGYDWAPAWVIWGDYNDYYCWAPIGPGAVISPSYRPDAAYWNFVPRARIAQPNPDKYVVHRDALPAGERNVINQRINVNTHAETYRQSVFFAGPKTRDVEKATGAKIERTRIVTVDRAAPTTVKNNEMSIYRPNRAVQTQARPAAPQQREVSPNREVPANRQPVTNANSNNDNKPQQQQQPTYASPRNVEQPNRNTWTPPRENIQIQQEPMRQQPAQQYNPPVRQERNFIPTEQPQMQQQHINVQPNMQPSRPAPAPGRGPR